MDELVYINNSQALTTSLLVAEKFGKEHKHVLEAIRSLIKGCAGKSAHPMFTEMVYTNEQNKQEYPMFAMNRDGFTLLAMGFTGEKALDFKLEYINAFNEMEKAIKNTLPCANETEMQIAVKMKAATWAAGFLKMNEASKLLLAKSVLEPLGLPLPDYVPSRGVTHSASELLKRHGVGMSAVKFNERLVEMGFLAEETRQGRNGEHRFKVITGRGLEYGENVVSPKSQKETQPHWYDGRFGELVDIVMNK